MSIHQIGDKSPIQKLSARCSSTELAIESLREALARLASVLNAQATIIQKLISIQGYDPESFIRVALEPPPAPVASEAPEASATSAPVEAPKEEPAA